jgi:hypothetical protein
MGVGRRERGKPETGDTTMNDFSKKTIRMLAKKGISLIGLQAIPDEKGSFLNSQRGYVVNDNGTCRVLLFLEVMKIAEGK